MRGTYKVIFDGTLHSGLTQADMREKLLSLYHGDQRIVNLFFTGKRLVVRKNLDKATALKSMELLGKAGVPCRLVEEETDQQEVKTQGAAPAPVTHSASPTTTPQKKEDNPGDAAQQEQLNEALTVLSFRAIIAESWNLIYGVKGELVGACLLAAAIASATILLGYGTARMMGETTFMSSTLSSTASICSPIPSLPAYL